MKQTLLISLLLFTIFSCEKETTQPNPNNNPPTTNCGTDVSKLINKWWKHTSPTSSTPYIYFNSNGKYYADFSPYDNVDGSTGLKGNEDTEYNWDSSSSGDTIYVHVSTTPEKWKVKEICDNKFNYVLGSNTQSWILKY